MSLEENKTSEKGNQQMKLQDGEFGVIPQTGHAITTLVCTVALDFLLRHCEQRSAT